MMFPRALYDELGEFDESMWPCSGEEIDFCFMARKAGHMIGIAKDVYIHHYGSQTFNEMQNAGLVDYKDVCKKCDAHLSERWGEDFWHRQKWILKETGIRLNLGCGAYKMKGFINVDQLEKVNPDLVCDATELPYENETISEIYCGHLLEHMTLENGEKALGYWKKLLIPGGKITITVPDFDVLVTEYVDWPTTDKLKKLNDLYIYSYCQDSHHKYCYSADLLKEVMGKAGFTDLKRLPVDHPYFVDPVSWQVAFTGRKI
jgi:predicted SAM-dependent methyltransferase